MNEQVIQYIGYIGSVVIALAMLNSSIVKLRIFSLAGNILFVTYGLLIQAYPIAIVNVFIAVVNIVFLIKAFSRKDFFTIQEIRNDNKYLLAFLKFYDKEIQKSVPGFNYSDCNCSLAFFVLRNMAVAGVFLGYKTTDGELEVKLDFVIPQYRDFKIGRFIYGKLTGYFKSKEVCRLISSPNSKRFTGYIKKMGFVEEFSSDGSGRFIKNID